ncbi:PilN domain-containing protein [Chitinimonas sp. PSY-7]|uniref:PilN domain-containing protein n=1 Tax=Chitinimonas sp. PSY-7 TaxID=3459088 RepID=UPI00403FE9B2
MIRINLLPHREQKRKARLARFAVLAGISAGIGIAIVAFGYIALAAQIAQQGERNAFLEEENAKLDKQIAEIETLKKERQMLLDRKKVVERLQSNRSEAVQILDQLTRQTPEGIYLSEIKQENNLITLTGYAQSSARVSTLMRSLNDSPVFEQPNLIDITADAKTGQRLNMFRLTVLVTREADEDPAAKAKKGTQQ